MPKFRLYFGPLDVNKCIVKSSKKNIFQLGFSLLPLSFLGSRKSKKQWEPLPHADE